MYLLCVCVENDTHNVLQSQCHLPPRLTADCSRFLLYQTSPNFSSFGWPWQGLQSSFLIYLFPFRYWLFDIVFWSSGGMGGYHDHSIHTHTEGKAEKASITASVRHCRDHYLVVAVEYPEAHVDDHLLTSFPPQLALFLFCRGCCYVDILVIIPFFSAFIVTVVPRFYLLLFGYTMYIQLARC